MTPPPAPAAHTVAMTIGTPDGGYNANMIYRGKDVVAMVYGIFAHQQLDEVKDDPRCAEGLRLAKLFASAPALLAALEAACRDADHGLEHGDPYPPWYEAARTAIRAARGEG